MDIPKSAASTVVKVEKKLEKKLTVHWNDLPIWQRDNQYIQTGYRPQSNSYTKSAKSLGYIHNETVNIYSHLIGAGLATVSGVLLYIVLMPRYETATREDILVFSCFFLGATACLGMSATYHTISNHSQAVSSFGNKLDYLGIVFLIWGSFIPVLYYGFQSDPHLIKRYWTMITTLAAGTSIVCVHPKTRTPALRPFRALMFVLMGLSAVFPVLHGLQLYGLVQLRKTIGLDWVILQGALYILGAGLYAARVPERFKPGHFDIWGSSHQIFHVLVVLAAASHLMGMVKAFDHEHSQRDGARYLTFLGRTWS
ncbi:HlyIII-domain-containing protein [Polyplosphaeria fusca]|uniref:HlyIII-domain-containing protein n=1 Tax=Polyplosphaeria fusca TaxID=682080 RepID=A0A9P4QVB7_9PLEO|nr:HlyIII-domain-containing protein [Polyplosphaeria fusca]